MTAVSETGGAAIVCDLDGVITRFASNQLGISQQGMQGKPFAQIMDPYSEEKALGFIHAIRKSGAAFDWQLNALIHGQVVPLHCMGCRDGSLLWVFMAETQLDANRLLEEMSLVQNEQNTLLRSVLKESSVRASSARDDSDFEELTRLYNDLGKMQRELAQRNAELEASRASLEAQQAELLAANSKLDALAMSDGLTGIANRRAFQARLETECAHVRRYPHPLALMILDIDHFKEVNDTYGHLAGDEILQMMARLLAAHARNTDFVARYGGEEFVVILVNTDKDAAQCVAERLRRRIEEEKWPYRAITVSIGTASWNFVADSASALISRADGALYFSKNDGRNRATHCLDITAEDGPVTST